MKASRVLNKEDAVLVVVDVQERLVPAIDKELYARSLKNFKITIEAAGTLGLPIVLTEQYPKGLGRTVPDVLQALEGKTYERIEKVAFSCARDEAFLAAIAKRVLHDGDILSREPRAVMIVHQAILAIKKPFLVGLPRSDLGGTPMFCHISTPIIIKEIKITDTSCSGHHGQLVKSV